MRHDGKPVFFALILLFLVGAGGVSPALASLMDYGIWMSAITGSTSMKLDERIQKRRDDTTTTTTSWTSNTSLRTNGVVWDYRFMKFTVQLSYASSAVKSRTTTTDGNRIGFNFTTTLFPQWRFPYRPILINASKTRSVQDDKYSGLYETDSTNFGVRWGLSHKLFGTVHMLYRGNLEEAVAEDASQTEGDEQRHEIEVKGKRDFRKGQWGQSRVEYGYEFDFLDETDDTYNYENTFVQHYLFARDNTELGERARFSADAAFFQRSVDANNAEQSENFFTAGSQLSVKQTERLTHRYALGLSRSDTERGTFNTYNGSAGLNYRYRHEFDKYWSGAAGAAFGASFAQLSKRDDGESGMDTRGSGRANGSITYRRTYADFAITGSYRLGLAQPLWVSRQAAYYQRLRITQSGNLGYSRRNSPLYMDSATVSANYSTGEVTAQGYNLSYHVTSKLSPKDRIRANAKYRLSIPGTTGKTSDTTLDSRYVREFRRGERAEIMARYGFYTAEQSSDYTRTALSARYSGHLMRRYNLRFTGQLSWSRQTRDAEDDVDRMSGSAALAYSIGKFTASLSFRYSTDDEGGVTATDQAINFAIKRNFSIRL